MDQRNADFVRLLKRYDRRLAAYVFSLVPDWNDAEDILQDTWVRLWEQFDEYRQGEDFGVWACTIARYLVMAYRKRMQRERLHFSPEVVDMGGYIGQDSTTTPVTVTVSGLSFPRYQIVLYSDGDNANDGRIGKFTVAAGGDVEILYIRDAANTNFHGVFVQVPETSTVDRGLDTPAGNYAIFTHNGIGFTADRFTLTGIGTRTAQGYYRAPVNGIQILPFTPPTFPTTKSHSSTTSPAKKNIPVDRNEPYVP